jgi:transposase
MMMAGTLARFSVGILSYYRYHINTANLEGLNTKIKAMIRRAYGFRNMNNFIRMILANKEFNPLTLLAPAPG